MIKNTIKAFIVYGIIAGIAVIAINTLPIKKTAIITVKKGQYVNKIINNLEKNTLIQDGFAFKLFQFLTFAPIKAGGYQITYYDTPASLSYKMRTHDVEMVGLTIPEGFSTQQMLEILEKSPYLSGTIQKDNIPLLWLPETYHFEVGYSRNTLLKKMAGKFTEMATPLWENRQQGLPFKTLLEAVSLAAVVEKETGINGERPLVASVFVNRLRKNMRLQSDPTVIYALTNGYGKMDRELTRADWKYEHPYNTYRNRGIPPAPIAGVGKKALHAVLNPPKTDYIYFVATGKGGHNFAVTLREHNNNIIQYKKNRRK